MITSTTMTTSQRIGPLLTTLWNQPQQLAAPGKIIAEFSEFMPVKDFPNHRTQGFLNHSNTPMVYMTNFMRTLPDSEVRVCEVGFLNLGDEFTLWKYKPEDTKEKKPAEFIPQVVPPMSHAGVLTGELFAIEFFGNFCVSFTFTNLGQVIIDRV